MFKKITEGIQKSWKKFRKPGKYFQKTGGNLGICVINFKLKFHNKQEVKMKIL